MEIVDRENAQVDRLRGLRQAGACCDQSERAGRGERGKAGLSHDLSMEHGIMAPRHYNFATLRFNPSGEP
ncbi:hypothetical protein BEL01nite_09320 [Bradyrhizobium elkanii]|nr:hypothetical protein BEL01nite_09320 [Bradyrhizobium elkanii]